MNGTLLAAFFAETAIVTYRQYAGEGVAGGGISVPWGAPMNLPLPSTYTAPVIFFGALALIPESGSSFAGLVGWGIVLATLLNLWNPSGQVKPTGTSPLTGVDTTQQVGYQSVGGLPTITANQNVSKG